MGDAISQGCYLNIARSPSQRSTEILSRRTWDLKVRINFSRAREQIFGFIRRLLEYSMHGHTSIKQGLRHRFSSGMNGPMEDTESRGYILRMMRWMSRR